MRSPAIAGAGGSGEAGHTPLPCLPLVCSASIPALRCYRAPFPSTVPPPSLYSSSPPHVATLTLAETGILPCSEFRGLGWETRGLPSAALSDVLRCHDWSYVQAVAKVWGMYGRREGM